MSTEASAATVNIYGNIDFFSQQSSSNEKEQLVEEENFSQQPSATKQEQLFSDDIFSLVSSSTSSSQTVTNTFPTLTNIFDTPATHRKYTSLIIQYFACCCLL